VESGLLGGAGNRKASSSARTADEDMIGRESSSCHGQRILFVDDDSVGLRVRGELFEELGYSVVLCDSPAVALSCDLSTFDLGVLDFHMPELNGRELLLRMRAAGGRFPIILLTGYLDFLDRENRVLFARCIDKGEPIQRLLDCIAQLLDPNQLPDYGT
jgi:CheY-like chemotaxis protein